MKNFFKLIGIIAFVALIVVEMTSCNDIFSDSETSFKMTGSEFDKVGSDYRYIFVNQSKYDVKITVDDVTQTIYKVDPGWERTLYVNNSSKTITVKYSPSNNVSYDLSSGVGQHFVTFRNRN